jgi:lipopolysaccharide export system protein LptA
VLTGNAVVKQQGRGEFHGDKLTYNTQTALITGEAGGDGLVHGVILPKAQPGAPAPAGQVASPTCHPNAPAATPAATPATAPATAPKPAGGH